MEPRCRMLDPLFIPLSDGTRLAARIWLPTIDSPVPAILEPLPYRRNDGTFIIDQPRYTWWAEHGFAGVRVDIRGSGDSDGLITDEYLRQEQDDTIEVLAWLADQPWCTGRVAMMGFSWGGFAGLQVAARRPPQLTCVVTVNSVVRRYTDDCHYTGGCVNAYDLLSWADTMYAWNARPPDPAIVGDRWREMWMARLNAGPPMIETWLSHQLEDDYWRHGSVCFDYDAITVPVLAVGGWADPYRNAVLDLVDNLPGLASGIVGPWAHGYPHATGPGPQIDFLGACAAFFDQHLLGRAPAEPFPRLRTYIQEFDPPEPPAAPRRTGRWVSAGRSDGDYRVEISGGLVSTNQLLGASAGAWCPYGETNSSGEQRQDDAMAWCIESDPLIEPVEILGFPMVRLRVEVDQPDAFIAVRLCDVAPDGSSVLVTRGILNLTHRHGHDRLTPLPMGEAFDVEFRLDAAGHRFRPGHRVRVAMSTTYWPWIWPSPTPVTMIVLAGEVTLPMVAADSTPADLGEPDAGTAADIEFLDAGGDPNRPDFLLGRLMIRDLGLISHDEGSNTYTLDEGDPLSARVRIIRRSAVARDGWSTIVEADAEMTCSATSFRVESHLAAWHDDVEVFRRIDVTVVPRATGRW